MNKSLANPNVVATIRLVARVGMLLAIALFVLMQLAPDPRTGGYNTNITTSQVILALLFPGIAIVGYILTWRREALGGALIVASFPLFVLGILLMKGRWIGLWTLILFWAIFAAPGILFLLCWRLSPRERDAERDARRGAV